MLRLAYFVLLYHIPMDLVINAEYTGLMFLQYKGKGWLPEELWKAGQKPSYTQSRIEVCSLRNSLGVPSQSTVWVGNCSPKLRQSLNSPRHSVPSPIQSLNPPRDPVPVPSSPEALVWEPTAHTEKKVVTQCGCFAIQRA